MHLTLMLMLLLLLLLCGLAALERVESNNQGRMASPESNQENVEPVGSASASELMRVATYIPEYRFGLDWDTVGSRGKPAIT